MQSMLRGIIESKFVKGKILFVVNIGLHYHMVDSYRESLRWLFKYFSSPLYLSFFDGKNEATGSIVVFREMSAQHFRTANGEFPLHDQTFDWIMPVHLINEIQGKLAMSNKYVWYWVDFSEYYQSQGIWAGFVGIQSKLGPSNEENRLCQPSRLRGTPRRRLSCERWKNPIVVSLWGLWSRTGEGLCCRRCWTNWGWETASLWFHSLISRRRDTTCTAELRKTALITASLLLWLPVWDNLVRIYKERRNVWGSILKFLNVNRRSDDSPQAITFQTKE